MLSHQEFGRADLHMHTRASDGMATVQELLDYVAKRGHLDVIAITDHDTLEASLWAYEHRSDYPFDIVPGMEVTSAEGHVLALWVTTPIARGMSMAKTAAAIHEQGGLAVLAHPYHIHLPEVMTSVGKYLFRPQFIPEAGIDALEVHNAVVITPGANLWARMVARHLGMAVTADSDAHSLGGIGRGMTRFPGRSGAELRQALEQHETVAWGRPWPLAEYLKVSRYLGGDLRRHWVRTLAAAAAALFSVA